MLDPSIFTTETPLSPAERLELWRRKLWGVKLQDYWNIAHPQEDGVIVDSYPLGEMVDVPQFLRRQAE